ncbi:hypothetical protein APHMUC_0290 [Anaplasma phagocytophilum str. ApMUC09]|uniref:Uncharacterized protein n=1 Tax=Anaplasma phagocytophilum str. ApMUC09 TaxID=1359152 RepID=A0A0F3N8Y9_ANAPH|nr:hypothetical protein APHMUC_0290 [Anaplasma phagocytophilum str. ApMUC09]
MVINLSNCKLHPSYYFKLLYADCCIHTEKYTKPRRNTPSKRGKIFLSPIPICYTYNTIENPFQREYCFSYLTIMHDNFLSQIRVDAEPYTHANVHPSLPV